MHKDEVQVLAVDNQSELGGGRFVMSYDAGQTAIVWDLMTGDEVARFASFDHITCAAWMKNGNVACGMLLSVLYAIIADLLKPKFMTRKILTLLFTRKLTRKHNPVRAVNIRTHLNQDD